MQEALDHIAARVGAAGLTGAVAGSLLGLYRGHYSAFRTASLTSLSCAMAATACFGGERILYVAGRSYIQSAENSSSDDEAENVSRQIHLDRLKLFSHVGGGLLGGAWIGTVYYGNTFRGALFFTSLMMMISVAEDQLAVYKFGPSDQRVDNDPVDADGRPK
jgi:hypothetical protein